MVPDALAVIWTAAASNAVMKNVTVFFVVILQYPTRYWFLLSVK